MRPFLPALLFLAALPGLVPSLAADHAPVKGGAPGTNVEMPFLMAPIADSEGKLFGYAYIATRLTASSDSAANDVRMKIPFVQDAFVRDLNARGVTRPGDMQAVDIAAVESRLLANARRVVGATKVKSLTVCTVQISPLRPQPHAVTPPEGHEGAQKPPASRCES